MCTFLIFGITGICVWKRCRKVGQENESGNIVEEIEMVDLGGRNVDNVEDGGVENGEMVETNITVDVENGVTAGLNNLTQVKYPPPPRPPMPPPPMPRRSKRKPKSKKNKN